MTDNHGVYGSIPPLGTNHFKHLTPSDPNLENALCGHCVGKSITPKVLPIEEHELMANISCGECNLTVGVTVLRRPGGLAPQIDWGTVNLDLYATTCHLAREHRGGPAGCPQMQRAINAAIAAGTV